MATGVCVGGCSIRNNQYIISYHGCKKQEPLQIEGLAMHGEDTSMERHTWLERAILWLEYHIHKQQAFSFLSMKRKCYLCAQIQIIKVQIWSDNLIGLSYWVKRWLSTWLNYIAGWADRWCHAAFVHRWLWLQTTGVDCCINLPFNVADQSMNWLWYVSCAFVCVNIL